MHVSEAKTKVCPFMSNYDNKCNCIINDCMSWEYEHTHEKAKYVTCHRCHEEVSTERDTCSYCYAFIRGYGAKIPLVELEEDEKEGYCKRIHNDN